MEQEIKISLAFVKIKPKGALCVFMFRCLLNLVWDVLTFLKLVTAENRLGKHASFCLPVLFG